VPTDDTVMLILRAAKKLAQKHRDATGKPLGITGEVAEYEAARILGIKLTPARQAGTMRLRGLAARSAVLQIKGRCMLPGGGPNRA